MTSAQNRDIGEIFLEILNNPAIFEDEELFQFVTAASTGFATGTIADLADESETTFVNVEGSWDTVFKFDAISEFNALRITYRSTSGTGIASFDLYTEDPYGSGNFSSAVDSYNGTDGAWVTVDIDLPAGSFTLGEDLGINIFGGNAEIAYMALV